MSLIPVYTYVLVNTWFFITGEDATAAFVMGVLGNNIHATPPPPRLPREQHSSTNVFVSCALPTQVISLSIDLSTNHHPGFNGYCKAIFYILKWILIGSESVKFDTCHIDKGFNLHKQIPQCIASSFIPLKAS